MTPAPRPDTDQRTTPQKIEVAEPDLVLDAVRAAMHGLPVNAALIDRDGRIVAVTRRWECVAESAGLPGDHAIGADYFAICRAGADAGETAADAVAGALRRVLDGAPEPIEVNYTMPVDGQAAWFSVTLSPWTGPGPYGAVACHNPMDSIHSDEPGIKGLHVAGHEAEARASTIDHSIISMTDRQGRITYVNDRFCAVSGYSRHQLIGKTHRLVNSGTHPREFFADLWQTVLAGKIWKGTICNRDRAGNLLWLATTIAPLRDTSGAIVGFISVRHDDTELERAQQRLRSKNAELEELVYTVSHDLKNPLVTITGYITYLDRCITSGDIPQARAHADRIRRASVRMRQTIDDILRLCRVGIARTTLAEIDIDPVYRGVIEQFIPTLTARGIRMRTAFAAPSLRADPEQLAHVLQNLIGNAIAYGCGVDEPTITVGTERRGIGVCLSVADQGAGIDPRFHERIFRAFTRLHTDVEGTGLGLAIVRRIAEAHGGSAWIDSTPGQGACFNLMFPGLPPDPHQTEPTPDISHEPARDAGPATPALEPRP